MGFTWTNVYRLIGVGPEAEQAWQYHYRITAHPTGPDIARS